MHQQLACSVRSGLVVSDLSRKENNLLLVYKDVSEREIVFQIKKKSLMDGYVFLRCPLEKIETFPKIIVEILITEWGKIYYFIGSIDLTTLLYHLHHGQNRVSLEFGNWIIIPEKYSPHHKLRKCKDWKPANQKWKAARLLVQLGLRRLQIGLRMLVRHELNHNYFFQP